MVGQRALMFSLEPGAVADAPAIVAIACTERLVSKYCAIRGRVAGPPIPDLTVAPAPASRAAALVQANVEDPASHPHAVNDRAAIAR